MPSDRNYKYKADKYKYKYLTLKNTNGVQLRVGGG